MKKLKIILQSKIFIVIICLITTIYAYLVISNKYYYTHYNTNTSYLEGTIIKKNIDGNKLTLIIKAKEKVIINYYMKKEEELKIYSKYELGDRVRIKSNLKIPKENSNFNLFNYHKYLLSNKIYWICNTSNIDLIKKNRNIGYKIKNYIQNRISYINSPYLYTFILGDNSYIESEVMNSFRSNGISHLFALSGMHVSLITILILKILKKITENRRINLAFITLFLLFYAFIAGFNPSITRACLLSIILYINNKQINASHLLILLACVVIIYNPYIIYNVAFQFSYIITFYLIISSKFLKKIKNYFYKIFIVSLISLLASIPIMINHFHSINVIGFIYNLFYIPFVSFIILPLVFVTFLIPSIKPILDLIGYVLEITSICLSNIKYGTITLCHCSLIIIIIYYVIITFIIYKINKHKFYYIILIAICLLLHYHYSIFNKNVNITFLDVGQGDSALISFPYQKNNILIDTGGKVGFKEKWMLKRKEYSIANDTIIPYLKSMGINHLNYIILSHGDYDHMGEAINLVNNFKVEKVIFNCGEFNDLEKELIKVLDKKKIKYYSCINELNIDNNKLYFLQTKEYDNENDNSNVIYTELNGYKFMFMGDAGVTTEKEIMSKYNLPNIDVLKVGHHGSRTSSGKEFINEINPNYSIISVGKNNRYGHPNKEVLDNLKKSKIYRTDQDGSIMFKIKNKKLKIETCSP